MIPGMPIPGMPMYATVWIALTPATPESSCLYFIPKGNDAGYFAEGDALDVMMPSPSHWHHIVAQPCEPGDILCFSHRVVHWAGTARGGGVEGVEGGRATTRAAPPPRVALSFALADPCFEKPNYAVDEFAPFPPVALRVALVAAQAILYHKQVPLSKGGLALNNRIFCASRSLFASDYAERIVSEAQYHKYKSKYGALAKKINDARA